MFIKPINIDVQIHFKFENLGDCNLKTLEREGLRLLLFNFYIQNDNFSKFGPNLRPSGCTVSY